MVSKKTKEKWVECRIKDKVSCELCLATYFYDKTLKDPNILNWHFFFEPFGFMLRFEVFDLKKGVEFIKTGCKENKLKKFKILSSYNEEKNYGEVWKLVKHYFSNISSITVFLHNKEKLKVGKDFRLEKLIHCFLNQNVKTYHEEMLFHLGGWFALMTAFHLEPTKKFLKRIGKND